MVPSDRLNPCTCGTSWGQAEAAKTWIGAAAGPRAPGGWRRGTSPAGPWRCRCRCAPGAFPGAELAGSPLPLWVELGEKKLISYPTERGQRGPHAGIGAAGAFCSFPGCLCGREPDRLFLNRRSTSQKEGARGSTFHCTASAKRSTFCLISSEDSN